LLGGEYGGGQEKKDGGGVRLCRNPADGVHGIFPSKKSDVLGARVRWFFDPSKIAEKTAAPKRISAAC
jgi:hypothetical protein